MADEGVLLHGAERMLRGSVLYADFFEILPPGGFILTAAWFGIAGISIWSARTLAILTIVGIACFTYAACREASKNSPLSAFLVVGWVVMSQGPWTQVNHHYFTTLFSMVAAWAALNNLGDKQSGLRWPLIAGTAAGAAAMFTPNCGVLAVLAAATAFMSSQRYRTELIAYGLGVVLVPTGLLAYVIWHHAFAAALYQVILYPAVHYAPANTAPFGTFASAQNFPLFYVFPLAGSFLVYGWRICLHDRLLRTCAALAIAGFIGCFPRPDIVHIAFAAPLACPLLACCMNRIAQRWYVPYRYAAAVVLIGLFTPAALAFSSTVQKALAGEIVPAPRGDLILLRQNGASQLLARLAALPPQDGYFFYQFIPMLPFLSAREHVSRYDVFIPGYTLPSQYQEACMSLLSDATWVIMQRADSKLYKQAQDAQPHETREFERALETTFDLVAREGEFELRRRREGVSGTVCTNITG